MQTVRLERSNSVKNTYKDESNDQIRTRRMCRGDSEDAHELVSPVQGGPRSLRDESTGEETPTPYRHLLHWKILHRCLNWTRIQLILSSLTAGNCTKLTMVGLQLRTAVLCCFKSIIPQARPFPNSVRLPVAFGAAPLEPSCIIFDDVASPTISKNYSSYRLPRWVQDWKFIVDSWKFRVSLKSLKVIERSLREIIEGGAA